MENVTAGRLFASALESINLASLVKNTVNLNQDMEKANTIKLETENWLTNTILSQAQSKSELATKTAYNLLVEALDSVPQLQKFFNQRVYNQALHSVAGYSLTAQQLDIQNRLWSIFNHYDFYSKILFDIPESFAIEKVKQWYNSKFGLGRITGNDAYLLCVNGYLKQEYLIDNEMLLNGIPSQDASKLVNLKLNQMQIPDINVLYWLYKSNQISITNALSLAKAKYGFSESTTQLMFSYFDAQNQIPDVKSVWRLWRKGLIDKSQAYNWVMRKYGFSEKYIEMLFADFDYDPTWQDVMNLSMLIPLPSQWVEKAFTKAGFSEEDKAIFKEAIEKKIIRDEIRSFWSILLQLYANGYYTDTQLEELLIKWKFSPQEIAIRLETAQIYRDKNVSNNMREAELYLYRRGVITENDLYAKLVTMGISEDVANSIVRLEAAKKGIDWEIGE